MTLKSQPSRPVCVSCGIAAARQNGTSAAGYKRWQKLCSACSRSAYIKDERDTSCQRCGFEASDQCQLRLVEGTTICQNCNALRLKNARQKEITVDTTVNINDLRL